MSTYTYPGVYVEEIPSGIRPIAGVSTSNTAFVGFFRRGPLNTAVRCNSYGDFEREFGGLDARSEASYGIQQYFLNGGAVAYVIRVAVSPDQRGNAVSRAQAAIPGVNGGQSITVTARSEGEWGNSVKVGVVHGANATDYSLSIREYAGDRVVRSEVFEGVNSVVNNPRNVVTVVNAASTIATVALDGAERPQSSLDLAQAEVQARTAAEAQAQIDVQATNLAVNQADQAVGPATAAVQAAIAAFVQADANVVNAANLVQNARQAVTAARIASIDGSPAIAASLVALDDPNNGLQQAFDGALDAWQQAVNNQAGADYTQQVQAAFDGAAGPGQDPVLADAEARAQSEAAAQFVLDNPPADPGGNSTAHTDLTDASQALVAELQNLEALRAPRRASASTDPAVLAAESALDGATIARTLAEAAAAQAAEQDPAVIAARTALAQAQQALTDAQAAAATASAALVSAHTALVNARRAAVIDDLDDVTAASSHPLVNGRDGEIPGTQFWRDQASTAIKGTQAGGTGLYALDAIAPEIFNLLCIPDAPDLSANGLSDAYAEAEAYCTAKRAFLIVDPPADAPGTPKSVSLNAMLAWPGVPSTNAATYYPRLRLADPLDSLVPKSRAASGTIAGIYARTDASRGVWKAPAGTDTTLRGPGLALEHQLTDKENGQLNVVGKNVLRNFALYNNVSWGSRTTVGADAIASEWKYVPVRRTALFIEESLYQRLKWVVFEPNDEPLWASIRMNVRAFMQGLFQRGAFQGSTADRAYLVKCDRETTTQADINLGVVNIVVGFAPLKPTEFVVIKLTQLAGQPQA